MSRNQLADAVNKFNGNLRALVEGLVVILGADPEAEASRFAIQVQRNIKTALDFLPTSLIGPVGKYLLAYENEITDRNYDFFLGVGFDSRLASHFTPETPHQKQILGLVNALRQAWLAASPDVQGQFAARIDALLDNFIAYIEVTQGTV